MFVVAAIPFILIGEFTNDWRALIGGGAFLLVPQIVGWLLYVGLATGRMPSAYGRSELRSDNPIWFWLTGGAYAALLLLFLWITLGVIMGGSIWSF